MTTTAPSAGAQARQRPRRQPRTAQTRQPLPRRRPHGRDAALPHAPGAGPGDRVPAALRHAPVPVPRRVRPGRGRLRLRGGILRGAGQLRRPVRGRIRPALPERLRQHHLLHRHHRVPRNRPGPVPGPGHEPRLPRPVLPPRQHPGALGRAHRRLRPAVALDLPVGRHRQQPAGQRNPLDRRRQRLQAGRHHRRGLEDRPVHRPAGPGRHADHPRRGLRSRQDRRRRLVAPARLHHPAPGQAHPPGGRAVPHARCAAHVRPAVRPDRPRQGIRGNPLHAGLGRIQPAPLRLRLRVRRRALPVRRRRGHRVREGAGRGRHRRQGTEAHLKKSRLKATRIQAVPEQKKAEATR